MTVRERLLTSGFRCLLLGYLLRNKGYRKEIENNYYALFKKRSHKFFSRNAKRLSENFAFTLLGNRDFLPEIPGEVQSGKGGVFLTLHFGIWEVLPSIFARAGFRVGIAVSSQKYSLVSRILERIRRRDGVFLVRSVPEMLSLVRRGFLLGFAVDNTRRVERFSLDIFWRGFRIVKTPFVIAERAKCPLYSIFGFLSREKKVVVKIERINGPEEFARSALDFVREYPEEWVFWGK
uniref:Lysophospholipid acyltransferase family protein n=1 Tax=candidate division WOR-3 bacterium TaxID=2052148 RepID=A0A7C3URQ7_UNCW3